MAFDTHCHLDATEFEVDRDAVVARARVAGVRQMLVPAVTLVGCKAVQACAARYAEVLPAYGLHPLYVEAAPADALTQLADAVRQQRPVAIGEIGLDAWRDHPPLDVQMHWFVAQLELARREELPVVLHLRHAVEAVCQTLRAHPVPGGFAHAFNGSRQQADMLIQQGFALGFGGALTYPGSTRIRRLASELPLSAIVLETDAPDMAPVWLRQADAQAQWNEPAQLPRIAVELAALRGMPVERLLEITTANAERVLGR